MTAAEAKAYVKWGLVVLLALLLVSPLVVLPLRARAIRGEESPCRKPVDEMSGSSYVAPAPERPLKGKGSAEPVEEKVTLNLREDEATNLAFGRSLETKRLDVWLDIAPPNIPNSRKRLRLVAGDFRRADDARISPAFLHANARMIGTQVRLRVCLERIKPGDIDPGTYTGRITFFDKRVEPYTVPLTITLAYPVWPWPTLVLYLVVVGALAYVWALKEPPSDEKPFLGLESARSFGGWLRSWPGVLSIGAGVAGAVTAFVATYINSPDWGSSISQMLGLAGATFTAFVTAATVTRGTRRKSSDQEK